MNGTYDKGGSEPGTSEAYEDEGGLDPRGAARLLERTTREAERELDFRSPWLSVLAAAVALVAVYVLMAALAHDGASDGVVYGVYVVTATLIVLGTFWAARSAIREDWPDLGLAIAIVLVAAGSAFAGPRGVWLSDGIGLCVLLLGYSAAQALAARGVSIRRMMYGA